MGDSKQIIITGVRKIEFKREEKGLGSNTYIVVLEGKIDLMKEQEQVTPEELTDLKTI